MRLDASASKSSKLIDLKMNVIPNAVPKWQHAILWTTLLVYLLGRVAQLYADRLPTLLIVVLHVVPPAVFAIVHGSILYRLRGMLAFVAFV